MPFSTPLNLQQLLGLMVIFNMVLPWNCSKSGESFHVEDIYLEDPEESSTFSKWEFSYYGSQLCLFLNRYKKEISARKASFRRLQQVNVCLLIMLGSQFLCLAHFGTKFQLAVDKPIMIPKVDCYKGKEKMTGEYEDVPSTPYVKARLDRLFKHEVVVMQQMKELTSIDWQDLQRYYIVGAYCSSLEPKEKSSIDGVHHTIGRYFQTINHNLFVVYGREILLCLSTTSHSLLILQTLFSPLFIMSSQSLKR